MSEASAIVSNLFAMGIIVGFAIAGLFWIASCNKGRRTKEYRKDLTNLYVAGKIRQIANEGNINISDEYEVYKQFSKKRRMEDWDLDVALEEELKDKITEEKKEITKKGA